MRVSLSERLYWWVTYLSEMRGVNHSAPQCFLKAGASRTSNSTSGCARLPIVCSGHGVMPGGGYRVAILTQELRSRASRSSWCLRVDRNDRSSDQLPSKRSGDEKAFFPNCQPSALVFEAQYSEIAKELCEAMSSVRFSVRVDATAACPYEALLAARRHHPRPDVHPEPKDIVYLIYTSGTTGAAEGRDAEPSGPGHASGHCLRRQRLAN